MCRDCGALKICPGDALNTLLLLLGLHVKYTVAHSAVRLRAPECWTLVPYRDTNILDEVPRQLRAFLMNYATRELCYNQGRVENGRC